MKSLNVSRWKFASTSAEQKCFRIRTDNGAGFPAGTLARYYPGIEDGCVTTGVLRQGGHETHGETDPLGSEILNGNDYSKLLLLGLGVPNSHSVGLLKPVHPFVQPLIPPPESTLQIFIVSTLFQARLAPEHHPPLPPSPHPVDTLSIYIYIYICTYMYIYIYHVSWMCVYNHRSSPCTSLPPPLVSLPSSSDLSVCQSSLSLSPRIRCSCVFQGERVRHEMGLKGLTVYKLEGREGEGRVKLLDSSADRCLGLA